MDQKKINLGCGKEKIEGWINIDSRKEVKPDKIMNIEKKLLFEDNTIDTILLKHVIEHVHNPIKLIDECYRILKPGGKLHVYSPHISQLESIGELDHKRHGLSVYSFHYTTTYHSKQRDYYGKAKFYINKTKITTHPLLQFISDLSVIKYEKYFSRIFGAREISFTLEKKYNTKQSISPSDFITTTEQKQFAKKMVNYYGPLR